VKENEELKNLVLAKVVHTKEPVTTAPLLTATQELPLFAVKTYTEHTIVDWNSI
jgi:hypothetical protein